MALSRAKEGVRINGRYQLHHKIGEGGMGIVYLATDRLTQEKVAFKQVHLEPLLYAEYKTTSSQDLRLALAQEFQILAGLRHPHIVSVLDYGFDEEKRPFFTMQYLPNAKTILEAGQDQPLERKIELIEQLLQALAYLHRRDILHHDLKPQNILVSHGVVRVLDFGLALSDTPGTSSLRGTNFYIPPEVWQEQPYSQASDLFTTGLIAYELLAEEHPFAPLDHAFLDRLLYNEPDLDKLGLNNEAAHVIARLLAKDPAQRYNNGQDALMALTHAFAHALPEETVAIRESYLQAAKFVGRELEMATLSEGLAKTKKGQGSAWLIGGESGVGKSRLLRELQTQALVEGFVVVSGQAITNNRSSYQLWRDPIRQLLLTISDVDPLTASVLKPLVPDIHRLLDREVHPAPELDEKAAQLRLFSTINRLFREQQRPVLLILEDLQWVGESLEIIPHLLRQLESASVMVVGTYRDDERPEIADMLEGISRLSLGRLNKSNVAELATAMLGEIGQTPELITRLQQETEGNVFFLVEVVRALAEQAGHLSNIGQISLPKRLLPDGIQTIIQDRLARVPAEDHHLLALAAVVGRTLDLGILQLCNGGDEPYAWMNRCADAAVLDVQDGRWQFAHDKIREGLLASLSPHQLTAHHRQVAQAIEKLYPDDPYQAEHLMHHWGKANERKKEHDYALQAGRLAAAHYANQDAIRYLSRALELTPETANEQRYEVLIERERVYFHIADRENQKSDLETLEQLCQKIDQPNKKIEVCLKQSQHASLVGEYKQAIILAQQGLAWAEAIADEHLKALAYYYWADALRFQGEFNKAEQYAQRCRELSQRLGDIQNEIDATRLLSILAFPRGRMDVTNSYMKQCLALSRKVGDLQGEARTLSSLSLHAISQGDYFKAKQLGEQGLAIDRQIGNRYGEGATVNILGRLENSLGRYDVSQTYFETTLLISREIADKRNEGYALNNIGMAYHGQGRFSDAISFFQKSIHLKQEIGERWSEGYTWNKLGYLHYELADFFAAQAAYEQAESIFATLPYTPSRIESMAGLAVVSVALKRLPEAYVYAQTAWKQIGEQGLSGGIWDVFRSCLALFHAFAATKDCRAPLVLTRAFEELQKRAVKISDTELRQSFLQNISTHREIIRLHEEMENVNSR